VDMDQKLTFSLIVGLVSHSLVKWTFSLRYLYVDAWQAQWMDWELVCLVAVFFFCRGQVAQVYNVQKYSQLVTDISLFILELTGKVSTTHILSLSAISVPFLRLMMTCTEQVWLPKVGNVFATQLSQPPSWAIPLATNILINIVIHLIIITHSQWSQMNQLSQFLIFLHNIILS